MKTILLLWFAALPLAAQSIDARITLKGTLTTSTRFLYDINQEIYSGERVLESNYGFGADVRWKMLWDRFYAGISVERIQASEVTYVVYTHLNNLRVPSEEGFEVTAVELSGYYIVPISSEHVHFYIGGGFGLYDGERLHTFANVRAATISSTSNIGIHVLTGVDYNISERFALRGELKFRDPHFDVTDKFDQTITTYRGYTIQIPVRDRQERTTRVNLFGVNYMIGVVITL